MSGLYNTNEYIVSGWPYAPSETTGEIIFPAVTSEIIFTNSSSTDAVVKFFSNKGSGNLVVAKNTTLKVKAKESKIEILEGSLNVFASLTNIPNTSISFLND